MGKKKKEIKEKPLEKMTAKELREVGKQLPEITGVYGMNKAELINAIKKAKGIKNDTDLEANDLKKLVKIYKKKIKQVLKKDFPDDPVEQLWGAISAVFQSWNGKRAIAYRRIENISDEWGTAVNVQAMVFGNMGEN